MNELLDLYLVQCTPPKVEWVDGFEGMDAITRYLTANPDPDHHYCVCDIANNIRAVAFFTGDNLLLLTSGGEVVRESR